MRKIHGLKLILIFVVLTMGGCAAPTAPSPTPAPTQPIKLANLTQAKSIVKTEIEVWSFITRMNPIGRKANIP